MVGPDEGNNSAGPVNNYREHLHDVSAEDAYVEGFQPRECGIATSKDSLPAVVARQPDLRGDLNGLHRHTRTTRRGCA